MELRVINPGIDYMIERIMDFQSDDAAGFWTAPLYHFYPQLNREYAASLSLEDRRRYIGQTLHQAYVDELPAIDKKSGNMPTIGNSTRGKSPQPCPMLLE